MQGLDLSGSLDCGPAVPPRYTSLKCSKIICWNTDLNWFPERKARKFAAEQTARCESRESDGCLRRQACQRSRAVFRKLGHQDAASKLSVTILEGFWALQRPCRKSSLPVCYLSCGSI